MLVPARPNSLRFSNTPGAQDAMTAGLLRVKTLSREPWGPLGPALVFQCLQSLAAHLLRFSFRCRSQPKMVIPASPSLAPLLLTQ